MQIDIMGKDYHVGAHLKDIIAKKVLKLEKYFDDRAVCKVVCREEGKTRFILELTIKFNGMFVRGEVSGENMYDNIDAVLPKIEKQLAKYKDKLQTKLRKDAFTLEEAFEAGKIEFKPRRIVKTKTFELTPMNVEEAILQLDLLGHDFFVFLNVDNGRTNVIYRRGDDNVGLIDPQ